jgi:hypothetical protein
MEVPHLGQVTINAVVYKQMSNGQFHPEAVWHDSFALNFLEEDADKCIAKLKKLIEEMKKSNA